MTKRIYYSIIPESFKTIDLDNKFFNSFKKYYPAFEFWFHSKRNDNAQALLIHTLHGGIAAFAYFKNEYESIELYNRHLPIERRLKIGSLKVDTRIAGEHLYHTFIERAIIEAQSTNAKSIYITLFDTCKTLIEILEQYNFIKKGINKNGELVYLKELEK